MKHLRPYMKKYRLQSILAPAFKMLEAGFDLTVPLLVARIIDEGIATGNTQVIWSNFALMLLMALLGLSCSFTAQYFAAKAAIGSAAGLRRDLLAHIQGLSFTELDTIGTSTLITRMTSDINQVQNGINMFLRLFLRSPFIVFGAMVLVFTINTQLALVFVAAIAVLFVIVFGIMKITNPKYKALQKNLDGVTAATRENLSGVRVIRAFGREDLQVQEFAAINDRLASSQLRVGRISAMILLDMGATMAPPEGYVPVSRAGVSRAISIMISGSSAGAKQTNDTTISPVWPLSAVPVLPPMR